ncbi:uncharacterized protein LOC122536710 [Frieseomelitta varia]|uniref:uncharacterized protein LOC122536710 n=1 Tax=Frieseomelitta varia TaxID=561572 RepID=UPI001CB6AEDE|nr:uncharacterized protein LOC122536710 [Frieseomelitta varia]
MYPSASINAAAAVAVAAAARHPGPPQPGQQIKFTVGESCDRIKEEFNFLQNQCHALKLECEKLATEKIEIQRHYVMISVGCRCQGGATAMKGREAEEERVRGEEEEEGGEGERGWWEERCWRIEGDRVLFLVLFVEFINKRHVKDARCTGVEARHVNLLCKP